MVYSKLLGLRITAMYRYQGTRQIPAVHRLGPLADKTPTDRAWPSHGRFGYQILPKKCWIYLAAWYLFTTSPDVWRDECAAGVYQRYQATWAPYKCKVLVPWQHLLWLGDLWMGSRDSARGHGEVLIFRLSQFFSSWAFPSCVPSGKPSVILFLEWNIMEYFDLINILYE